MKIANIGKLPSILRQLRMDMERQKDLGSILIERLEATENSIRDIEQTLRQQRKELAEISKGNERTSSRVESIDSRSTDTEHKLLLLKKSLNSTGRNVTEEQEELFAENHDLDKFYLEFEDKFRGSEEEIQKRQQTYVKLFRDKSVNKELPIIDLGCGRGEFLEILSNNGYRPVGVDLNESMVVRASKKGYEAVQTDAIAYLSELKAGSVGAISGFHLAEHIPFGAVLELLAEAYRCLAKGGVLLLETPNPENVYVGACSFHYDPSHLKPLPPAVMEFTAKFKGFEHAEILRLHPELTTQEIESASKNKNIQHSLSRLFGARDYALVAIK